MRGSRAGLSAWALVLFSCAALAACGGDDPSSVGGAGGGATTSVAAGGSGGAGTGGATSAFVMAPHPPFPVIEGDTAYVMAHPRLVTIAFQGDPNAADIRAVGAAIGASKWLADVGGDYGVGAGTLFADVTLPDAAPAHLTEAELLALIDQHMKAGLIPPPADDILYAIFLAKGMVYEDSEGSPICVDYFGYHWQDDVPSGTLTYAIIADCGAGLGELTATFAHEYIETASDPGFVGGYYLQLSPDDPWFALDGLENADLCDDAPYVVEGGFSYQRVWSNAAAAGGVTSPCAPVDPAEVFYDVFSDAPTIPTVAAGDSATFTLTGWSTAPVPDWQLTFDADYYGDFTPGVELSGETINNGKTVTVKLTVPPGTPSGRLGTAMMYSGPGGGRFWPVTVRSK